MEIPGSPHPQKKRAVHSAVSSALIYDIDIIRLTMNSLELLDQLSQCHIGIRTLREKTEQFSRSFAPIDRQKGIASNRNDFITEMSYRKKLRNLTSPPTGDAADARIKVAIIDNGADRIRSSVKDSIAKGVSFVTSNPANGDRILPWWMVSDPHGTQMASLVAKANPFCRLYIARVGKLRKDILPDDAAAVRSLP